MPPKKPAAKATISKPATTKAGATKGPTKPKQSVPVNKDAKKVDAKSKEGPPAKETTEVTAAGITVKFRQLDSVLLRDVGNVIKDSGKWPLVIDPSGTTATFLRHRYANVLNALEPSEMTADKIRLALLGSIRFGKIFVIDMMGVDMYDACARRFDEIQEGLLGALIDKSLLKNESYISFIKDSDGPEYNPVQFVDPYLTDFSFVLLTRNPNPPKHLCDRMYGPIRIEMQ
ncbi:IQ motif and ankyrin repeat domain-containing protein 1-like [Tubulanus polymorphus]|uniref:IQ motif and ankyrin repeat domain-containing protein 1-like n=1 Tax=Tubulanus polymorphus TaxID=672921 RepID=UPI003DA5D1A1